MRQAYDCLAAVSLLDVMTVIGPIEALEGCKVDDVVVEPVYETDNCFVNGTSLRILFGDSYVQ